MDFNKIRSTLDWNSATIDNVFGLTEYKGKDGKTKRAYYLGAPAKDGTIVTSRISEQELTSYGTKLGLHLLKC